MPAAREPAEDRRKGGDQRKDQASRTRLDAIVKKFDEVLNAFDRLTRTTRYLLAALFVVQIATGVFIGILLNDNSNRIADIQSSRLASCNDTNTRHDNAIAALKALEVQEQGQSGGISAFFTAAGLKIRTPQALAKFEAQQTAASFSSTVGLINAISPHRNCAQTVALTPTVSHPKRRH